MTDTWTWATVTAVSPLRIKVDGDTTALDATTDDLVGSLAVDDRVRVHLHADGIIVTGLQGGGTPEATAATANTLALRNGSGQLKAADGVADDDVATVGQVPVGDTGWLEMASYESLFEPLDDTSYPVRARLKNGVVYLKGLMARKAGDWESTTNYNKVFTLPLGMRPPESQSMPCGVSYPDSGASLFINSDGDVGIRVNSAGGWVSIAGLSFLPD